MKKALCDVLRYTLYIMVGVAGCTLVALLLLFVSRVLLRGAPDYTLIVAAPVVAVLVRALQDTVPWVRLKIKNHKDQRSGGKR